VLVALMAVCLFSCSPSKEDRAKKLIKEYMMENLKDPSSYQPVSFSKMDSVYSSYLETEEYEKLYGKNGLQSIFKMKSMEFEAQSSVAETKKETVRLLDSALYYSKKYDELESVYSEKVNSYQGKEFIGWSLNLKYRAKNSFGGLDFGEKYFRFDKDVTKITYSD